MENRKLAEGEYRFACIVWEHEPLSSGRLVELSTQTLGWKKSTTYTVPKKLVDRGILRNDHAVVTAAYVTAVVAVLRLVLKRHVPRQVVCLLWLVVFARLLVPVSLPSHISVVPDVQQVSQSLSGNGGSTPVPQRTRPPGGRRSRA